MKLKIRQDEFKTIILALAEFVIKREKEEYLSPEEIDRQDKADDLLGKLLFYQRQLEEENNEE